jgi:hypothetical protein
MDVNSYVLYGVPVVGLVMALVKIAREMGLPTKFAPALAILLGALGGVGIAYSGSTPILSGVVAGLVIGASASGFYDAAGLSSSTATTPPTVTPPSA